VYWEAARVPRARTTDPAFKFLWELPSTPSVPFVSTWDQRIPVHGVSWQDGVDYCEWLTEKCQVDPARAAWKGWRFRLPTVYELEKASRGVDGRTYPWGRDFDNAYVLTSSFFGTALPPENEFRFPRSMRASIDESPYGAFDLSGSLLEYGLTRRWTGEKGSGEARSAWKGGSVNESRAHAFKATAFGFGGLNRTASHDGFRIVAERIEASK
jgi:formylglycine-generating enzyme required for sulfatase activity